MRLDYAPSVHIVPVPCSGRVESLHLLKAIEQGADAVILAGCREGQCHFRQGNLKAQGRVRRVQRLLAEIGIEPERVEMVTVGAADARCFAQACRRMVARLEQLGPSPVAA